MLTLNELLQQGAAHAWLYLPIAIVLGALHGLEPGHSKTVMAAFIIAIRGTAGQAVLLGISAAISHSLVIWILAAAGLHYGNRWNVEATEPYFQMLSGALIGAMALWMAWRTRRDLAREEAHARKHAQAHDHAHPHDAEASATPFQDDHERAHASDLERRFAGRTVTHTQLIVFGLTGGLLPCPAALAVLLVCLQLKQVALGFVLVLGFSLGLALTLVASGSLAAWGVRHASRRLKGFDRMARRLPFASSVLLILIGALVFLRGWLG